jgi:hypothetical protein
VVIYREAILWLCHGIAFAPCVIAIHVVASCCEPAAVISGSGITSSQDIHMCLHVAQDTFCVGHE